MITAKDIENNLGQLALMQVVNNWYNQTNGSNVFLITEDWHKQEFQKRGDFVMAETNAAFEAAINSPVKKKILVLVDAELSPELIISKLSAGTFNKDVFLEQ